MKRKVLQFVKGKEILLAACQIYFENYFYLYFNFFYIFNIILGYIFHVKYTYLSRHFFKQIIVRFNVTFRYINGIIIVFTIIVIIVRNVTFKFPKIRKVHIHYPVPKNAELFRTIKKFRSSYF